MRLSHYGPRKQNKNRLTLQWRHNEHGGVSNHQLHESLLNRLFGNIKAPRQLPFVWEIHRWPVNSPHKGPVTRKMFPFEDVIMRLDSPKLFTNRTTWVSHMHDLLIYANSIIISEMNVLTWFHHYTTHCSITCVISFVVIFSCLLLFPILKPPNVLLKGIRPTEEYTWALANSKSHFFLPISPHKCQYSTLRWITVCLNREQWYAWIDSDGAHYPHCHATWRPERRQYHGTVFDGTKHRNCFNWLHMLWTVFVDRKLSIRFNKCITLNRRQRLT